MSKVKMRFSIVVEVDADEWRIAYGGGKTAKDVRDDMRSYFWTQVTQAPAVQETGAAVRVAR